MKVLKSVTTLSSVRGGVETRKIPGWAIFQESYKSWGKKLTYEKENEEEKTPDLMDTLPPPFLFITK